MYYCYMYVMFIVVTKIVQRMYSSLDFFTERKTDEALYDIRNKNAQNESVHIREEKI